MPEEHRPTIDTRQAGLNVDTLIRNSDIQTLGSVIMPVILKTNTDEMIKLKFYALVVPELTIPMFFSNSSLKDLGVRFYIGGDLNLDSGDEQFTIPSLPWLD
jgi:hypothetical protein